MSKELQELLKDLQPRQAVEKEEVLRLRDKGMPEDYLSFLEMQNGGFGRIGATRNYVDLWAARDVLLLNPYYEDDFAQRVMCIGSSGGGTVFGYDLVSGNFFDADEFAFSETEVHVCGPAFLDLMRYLAVEKY